MSVTSGVRYGLLNSLSENTPDFVQIEGDQIFIKFDEIQIDRVFGFPRIKYFYKGTELICNDIKHGMTVDGCIKINGIQGRSELKIFI